MDTGKRREIVRSDGFRFGNRRLWAACQSIKSVESCSAQKLRSSSSERNLGICFFVLPIEFLLSAIHVSHRDHSNQLPPNSENNEQVLRMANIAANDQGLVEENIFGFLRCDLMPLSIVLAIPFVPIEACALIQRLYAPP
jgi:hypothetical protein